MLKRQGHPLKEGNGKRTSLVVDNNSLNKIFKGSESLIKIEGGYEREQLQPPWDQVCLMIMRYFALEGHFKVY